MGFFKDVYAIMHYGDLIRNYEWEEHFTNCPTRFRRVRIYNYEGSAYLIEELNGYIIHFDELNGEDEFYERKGVVDK